MITQILSHAFAAISAFALIISVEVAINFKKPMILKLLFFSISINIFILNLSQLLNLHYFITEISRALLAISSFNLISILYAHKLKKDVLYLSLIFFILVVLLLSSDYYETLHQLKNLRLIVRVGRILLLIISLYLFAKQHLQLFKSLNEKSFYSGKIKKWTKFTILFFTIAIINNFASIFLSSENLVVRSVSVSLHLSICIFILYRPSFLNRTELSIKLGKTLRKNINNAVQADNFIFLFYTSSYFINRNASLEDLAMKLQVGTQTLSSFIYETTQLNFSDLINKSRVDYFITLVQSRQFDNYTIDTLSEIAGFGSRQNLYRNFKKFHGGIPSDLIRAGN
jgi:AraC-like DNA-binding protein